VGDGRIDVQNRTVSGTGHGWAGAQILFWNCDGARMVIHDPPGDQINWAIGCKIATITNIGDMTTEPLGFIESRGTHIATIPSLFIAQLNDRLGILMGVNINLNDTDFKLLPNPVSQIINFKFSLIEASSIQLIIINQEGKIIKSLINNQMLPPDNYNQYLDVSSLMNGIYFAKFTINNQIKTLKFVVNK